jgi:hypothetical protein
LPFRPSKISSRLALRAPASVADNPPAVGVREHFGGDHLAVDEYAVAVEGAVELAINLATAADSVSTAT